MHHNNTKWREVYFYRSRRRAPRTPPSRAGQAPSRHFYCSRRNCRELPHVIFLLFEVYTPRTPRRWYWNWCRSSHCVRTVKGVTESSRSRSNSKGGATVVIFLLFEGYYPRTPPRSRTEQAPNRYFTVRENPARWGGASPARESDEASSQPSLFIVRGLLPENSQTLMPVLTREFSLPLEQ